MFRRRTSSPGNIHYRININKNMCPNPVDIYIDGDTYQHSFNGSSLDIYRNKKIEVIRIGGQISQKDQQYEYNVLLGITGGVSKGTLTYLYDSGIHCDLADTVLYGNRTTEFIPITEITDPEEIIYFTYRNKMYNQITNKDHITWEGNFIANRYCIATNVCEGCEFFAIGTSSYNNNYKVRIIIVAP